MNKPKSIEEWKEIIVAGPLTCRFLDIPESAENLPKSEKMKFRQVEGTGTRA